MRKPLTRTPVAWAVMLATANLAPAPAPAAGEGYDDARVDSIVVAPVSVDGNGTLKATCKYGYTNTGVVAGYKVPWTAVQFYVRASAGSGAVVFHTQKTCVANLCTTETPAPQIPAPGRIVGCRIVSLNDGAELKDAITTNNQKEVYVAASASRATGQVRSGGSAGTSNLAPIGAAGNFSGSIKQCLTSLSASVAPAAQQFLAPQNAPADFAATSIILHLQSSQAAGNSFVCRYASHGKDVPDFAVTVKCPNAAPRTTPPNTFGCSG